MKCSNCTNTDPIITEIGRKDNGDVTLYYKAVCPFCGETWYWKEKYEFSYTETMTEEEIKKELN